MAQLDWYIRANLKPRHLQLLVALDDFRNTGRAAGHLNISQPAVSKALGELQRGLGVKLFERTARGVNPTPYGECLVTHARSILDQLSKVREELRGLQSGVTGKVRVGALSATVHTLIPRSLALLKERTRTTNVFVREGPLEALLPELSLGRLDLVVGRLPYQQSRDLEAKVLGAHPVVLVTRPRHPLTRRRTLAWKDLAEYPWVLPAVDSLLREPVESAFQEHGLDLPGDHIETISVHVTSGYVQMTDAIGAMARDVALYYRRLGVVSVLPLNFPRDAQPLGMTWHRGRRLSPSARLMMQCLEQAAKGPSGAA
jgi:DNA-binding transcriptional LysR family regulator